ncbi:MAG: protein-L-isoaspartate(D-aspartate) O-methyltransferase [Bacteroidetes bacterium]|nr:protein-L-isoaspartate(D-aspartate) O-methyltransferase [Bacteroidota bacterium]
MEDSFKHKGLRKRLIELLAQKGITDEKVLAAMFKIPRHFFLDSALAAHAYEDKALPIGAGQTISQPYTVAYQSQELEVEPGMKVLEVGTGSGYQAAVLCELGVELHTVERIRKLTEKATKMLSKLGYKPNCYVSDGSVGIKSLAPFDRIIVTAASPVLGEKLIDQLASPGIMVIPVGDKVQTMYKIVKDASGKVTTYKMDQFKFVPLIGEEGYDA